MLEDRVPWAVVVTIDRTRFDSSGLGEQRVFSEIFLIGFTGRKVLMRKVCEQDFPSYLNV